MRIVRVQMNPLSNLMRIRFNLHQEAVWKQIKRDYITIHDSSKVTPTMNLVGLGWLVAHILLQLQFCSCSNVGEE